METIGIIFALVGISYIIALRSTKSEKDITETQHLFKTKKKGSIILKRGGEATHYSSSSSESSS